MRLLLRLFVTLFLLLAALAGLTAWRMHSDDVWHRGNREPVGLAPDPALVSDPVVQVYGARALGIKGLFGVHSWVAVKPRDARRWTVYEVVGWRLRRGADIVVMRSRAPDGRWFGAPPELYADKRGDGVDALIERVAQAAKTYPYRSEYRLWPGPNSNTFVAWIAREVPELEIDLPGTAVGKHYLGNDVFGPAPSGGGVQVSFGGVLGAAASWIDGLEFNLLGMNFGIGPGGLKLPILGRLPADVAAPPQRDTAGAAPDLPPASR